MSLENIKFAEEDKRFLIPMISSIQLSSLSLSQVTAVGDFNPSQLKNKTRTTL